MKTLMIKKADIVLFAVMLLLSAILCIAVYGSSKPGRYVKVTVDGSLYGTYDITQDREVVIDTVYGHNKLVIKDGKAFMAEADCRDGYCKQQYSASGGIDNSSQTIVCLPHRVVVTVEGEAEEADPDAVDITVG